jgi:hypothetical protein
MQHMSCHLINPETLQSGRAHSLYVRALGRGQRGQFWSMLSGRSHSLLELASIEANCRVHGRCDVGVRTVNIDQIRGSVGRAGEFDRDFNPLGNYTQERWLSIATARERGKSLPPVALIQVGDVYFVQDGHHRISVARALGQTAIEATVQLWQVSEALPWDRPVSVKKLSLWPA